MIQLQLQSSTCKPFRYIPYVVFLAVFWFSSWTSSRELVKLNGIVAPTPIYIYSKTEIHNDHNQTGQILTDTKTTVETSWKRADPPAHAVKHLEGLRNATNCGNTSPFFNEHFRFLTDHLSPLWWRSLQGDDQAAQTDIPFWPRKLVVVIGDSLDRKMTDYVCTLLQGNKTKEEPTRDLAHPFICSSPTITSVYLNIFGMNKACPNNGARRAVEGREFNSTAERISTVLPILLDLLPPGDPPTDIFVQIGSNLWDLSQGCNDRIGIEENFAQGYRAGIRRVHDALRRVLHSYYPSSKAWILWKVAPPISNQLSQKRINTSVGSGYIRSNQEALNSILKDEVGAEALMSTTNTTDHQLKLGDGLVDVWSHVMLLSLPEDVLDKEFERDGFHYGKCASFGFFNLLLNVITKLHGR